MIGLSAAVYCCFQLSLYLSGPTTVNVFYSTFTNVFFIFVTLFTFLNVFFYFGGRFSSMVTA